MALSDGEYPGNQVMSRPRIAGDLVAVASGTGFASQAACYKFAGNDCADVPVWWVEVVDAQTRHRLRIATGSAAVGSLVITRSRAGGASAAGAASAAESASTPGGTSRAGAAAWIQGTGSGETLRATILLRDSRGRLTASPQTLDTGALGDSLRFTGFTLHWTNAGQPKSATLG